MLTLASIACTKREEVVLVTQENGCRTRIVINEIQASGSTELNEFGDRSDWLELHNAGADVFLTEGEWYLTDDRKNLLKFELPMMTLEEGDHRLIWCDGLDEVGNDIHASFHLAAKGEWLALVHATEGRACMIDSVSYLTTDDDRSRSLGRMPDGSPQWMPLAEPSPGKSNGSPPQ